jgi:threonine dehydratase
VPTIGTGDIRTSPDDPLPHHRLSLESIASAHAAIDPVFLDSPQFVSEPLGDALGCELTLKVETNNPIRSFKGRGAGLFLARVTERNDDRRLACASTGPSATPRSAVTGMP